jgi:hypothetical protein
MTYSMLDVACQPLSPHARDTISERYLAGESTVAIAVSLGLHPSTINDRLKRAGVPRRSFREAVRLLYPLREDAFDDVTEESAYWIGMLMADGCVYRKANSSCVALHLQTDDAAHVQKFADFLGYKQPIRFAVSQGGYSKDGNCRYAFVQIMSDRLTQRLEQFGVIPRKSLTAKVNGLEMNRHFWRGVVDGDGSLGLYENRRQSRWFPCLQVVGSETLMHQFADFVRSRLPGWRGKANRKETIYSVNLGASLGRRMVEVLYADCAVALDRKLRIADQIMRDYSPLSFKDAKWRRVDTSTLNALYSGLGTWGAVAAHLGTTKNVLDYIRRRHPDGN